MINLSNTSKAHFSRQDMLNADITNKTSYNNFENTRSEFNISKDDGRSSPERMYNPQNLIKSDGVGTQVNLSKGIANISGYTSENNTQSPVEINLQ